VEKKGAVTPTGGVGKACRSGVRRLVALSHLVDARGRHCRLLEALMAQVVASVEQASLVRQRAAEAEELGRTRLWRARAEVPRSSELAGWSRWLGYLSGELSTLATRRERAGAVLEKARRHRLEVAAELARARGALRVVERLLERRLAEQRRRQAALEQSERDDRVHAR
jgi:hypothetical protein